METGLFRVIPKSFWAVWLNKLETLTSARNVQQMMSSLHLRSQKKKKSFEVFLKNKAWRGAEIKDIVWTT